MIIAPKGTKDVLPFESYKWQYVENIMRKVCKLYAMEETRTPVFEAKELFIRGVGEVTDVVQKEMYEFVDKGGRDMALKPEGTAGVVRSFIEHGLYNNPLPLKQYYLCNPVFRYENTQSGRLREHHQFGIEVFGSNSALSDAEVISLALDVFDELGVCDLELHINSIGCPTCRKKYNEALLAYLNGVKDNLCKTCNVRINQNPLRILDCKEERCQEQLVDAPTILKYLCEDCETHFEDLKANLDALGIEYKIDERIVRGLDYYTKTVFEIISKTKGFSGTVCGGGRYDNLIEMIGGPQTGAVGFGMGMERLLLVMEGQGIEIPNAKPLQVYICTMDNSGEKLALSLCKDIRKAGLSCDINHKGRSVKAQFKFANKLNARYVITLGDDEINSKIYTVKDMEKGETFNITSDKIIEFLNENK